MTNITMTETQFNALEWTHGQSDCTWHACRSRVEHDMGDGCIATEPGVSEAYGYTMMRSVAPDGSDLTLTIDWMTSGDTNGTYGDLYDWDSPAHNETLDESVHVEPALTLLDGDGDALSDMDRYRVYTELVEQTLEWERYAFAALPKQPDALDMNMTHDTPTEEADMTMQTYTLARDDDRDVRFTGEKIASASSFSHDGPRNQRWTEIDLYRTGGDTYVAQVIGRTKWQGESTRYAVHIADTDDALVKTLGAGWLAKEIYDEAGIDTAVEIK